MSETATSAPTPVAPAAAPPAVVSTPVTPGPQVSPATVPGRVKPVAKMGNTVTKSYGTASPKPFEVRPAAPAAAPVAPAAPETPAVTAPAEPPAALELLPETAAATSETPAPETPAPETEPVEAEAPKIDKGEVAKRLAQIARAEGRLSEDKRKFAEERRQHSEALSRVAQMDKAKELVHKDAVGFLHRMFGVTPQQIVDQLVATSTGKPVANTTAPPTATDERIAALESQLREAAEKTKEETVQRQTRDYIKDTVTPIVTDSTKFPFLNHEFGGEAAQHVYLTMKANWDRDPSKPPPSPQVVAEFIEKHFRDKAAKAAQLLGGSAAPTQTANPKKVATPQAPPPVAAQPPAALRRPRLTGKPYTVTVK